MIPLTSDAQFECECEGADLFRWTCVYCRLQCYSSPLLQLIGGGKVMLDHPMIPEQYKMTVDATEGAQLDTIAKLEENIRE